MSIRVKVEGLKPLKDALQDLGKATGRNVMRRVLLERGEPIAEAMRQNAPVATGYLQGSIDVSTRLAPSARKGHEKLSDNAVEVFIGPSATPRAIMQEFGTVHHPPQPFARPAWDANKDETLEGIKDDIWAEIQKAVARRARKAAKAAAKATGGGE
jgi:HK97 gp10 family phage protein